MTRRAEGGEVIDIAELLTFSPKEQEAVRQVMHSLRGLPKVSKLYALLSAAEAFGMEEEARKIRASISALERRAPRRKGR